MQIRKLMTKAVCLKFPLSVFHTSSHSSKLSYCEKQLKTERKKMTSYYACFDMYIGTEARDLC